MSRDVAIWLGYDAIVPLRYQRPDGEPSVMSESSRHGLRCSLCTVLMPTVDFNRWYEWGYCLNPECLQFTVLVCTK